MLWRVELEGYFTKLCHKGDDVARHSHEFLELVYYSAGFGSSAIQNHEYSIHRGTFTITPSGIFHDQRNLTDLSSFCILLSDSHLENHIGGWTDAAGTVGRMVMRLDMELAERRRGYELIYFGILHEIAGMIERLTDEYRAHSHLSKRDLVGIAAALIQQKEGRLSVTDIAGHLNVSKDYLRHLFLEYSGLSPHKMIINTKIRKAIRLLQDSHFSVTEVAEQCGFADVYYFSSQFKKKLSVTPTQFRKRCTEDPAGSAAILRCLDAGRAV